MKVRIKRATLGKWKECKNKELLSEIFNQKKKKKAYYKSSLLMMFHNISPRQQTTTPPERQEIPKHVQQKFYKVS